MTKLEIKKSIGNSKMLIAILASFMCLLIGGFEAIFLYGNDVDYSYTFFFGYSSGTSSIMILIFPIFVCLPYANSYLEENKTGYILYKFVKISKSKYIFSKIVATALSGGLTMFIPTLAYLFLCIILKGSHLVDGGFSDITHGLGFFQNYPMLYCFLYVINSFICGVLFSLLGLSISTFIKNVYLSTLMPFALYIFCNIIFSNGITINLNPTLLYDINMFEESTFTFNSMYKFAFLFITIFIFTIGVYKNED
jgi:ABC-type transport system involved in multi-copper enzyme maturation permease subunit